MRNRIRLTGEKLPNGYQMLSLGPCCLCGSDLHGSDYCDGCATCGSATHEAPFCPELGGES